jgi:hypothetical protein
VADATTKSTAVFAKRILMSPCLAAPRRAASLPLFVLKADRIVSL